MKNRFQLCNPRCILTRSNYTSCLPSKLRKSLSRLGYSRVYDPGKLCSLSGSIRLLPSFFPEDSLLGHVQSACARENSAFLTILTIPSKSGIPSKRKSSLKRKTRGPGRSETAGVARQSVHSNVSIRALWGRGDNRILAPYASYTTFHLSESSVIIDNRRKAR